MHTTHGERIPDNYVTPRIYETDQFAIWNIP
jgi:hypothetical protein